MVCVLLDLKLQVSLEDQVLFGLGHLGLLVGQWSGENNVLVVLHLSKVAENWVSEVGVTLNLVDYLDSSH